MTIKKLKLCHKIILYITKIKFIIIKKKKYIYKKYIKIHGIINVKLNTNLAQLLSFEKAINLI